MRILFPVLIIISAILGLTFHSSSVGAVTTVSGENQIRKTTQLRQTSIIRTQLLRKLAVVREQMSAIKLKIKVVEKRVQRKIRMNKVHTTDDFAIKNLIDQYNQAETLASEIEKKIQETGSGVVQKVG